MSVYNTTFFYILQYSISSGRHVSTFTRSSSGPQRNRDPRLYRFFYKNPLWDSKCLL